jgi:hypothetical protein
MKPLKLPESNLDGLPLHRRGSGGSDRMVVDKSKNVSIVNKAAPYPNKEQLYNDGKIFAIMLQKK